MRKYRDARKIIAIQAINNFTVHRLLNPRAGVMSDTFCYHTTNNWEKLIDQEDEENTASIATPILTTICMYIRSTRFLEKRRPEIEYNADGAICGRCSGLDWRNNHEEEVAKETINKDDDDETLKQKARQIRKEKKRVKRNAEREKI